MAVKKSKIVKCAGKFQKAEIMESIFLSEVTRRGKTDIDYFHVSGFFLTFRYECFNTNILKG